MTILKLVKKIKIISMTETFRSIGKKCIRGPRLIGFSKTKTKKKTEVDYLRYFGRYRKNQCLARHPVCKLNTCTLHVPRGKSRLAGSWTTTVSFFFERSPTTTSSTDKNNIIIIMIINIVMYVISSFSVGVHFVYCTHTVRSDTTL